MANNKVVVEMELNDRGTTAKQIKSAEALAKAYDKAAGLAAKVNAPLSDIPSGTPGSKKAAKTALTGSTGLTGQEYGNARGTAGVTGASARDFANQSQGLGGLVRLYATYAANIFAVGAAFRALSTAMDTTNMVKGLDQLGAASGMALGSLSKRLVTATDGAISLREAMEATAKASSSGMNSQQILRMGEAAKKASQALGVDMGDAVSRLTRGITKLEPELLDELGIFVRVDDVVRDYAKSVGKSASALTDFERRQAYANAVLDQAERKFNAIKIDSNPYYKLSAALRDSLQSGLELINKVLTPLVSMLASSPSALVAIMVGISTVLLKQALPAIGQFRAGLNASAIDAANVAKKFKESFGDEFQARLEQRFRLPNLKAEVSKAESELAKLKFPGRMPKSLQLDETGALNQKNVNKLLETRNTLITTGMRGTKAASEAQVSAAKQEIAYIEKVIQLSEKRLALERASDQALGVASKKQNRFDPEIIAMKRAETLQLRADKAAAVSNASENARILGIRGSWQLLNQEIADKGIKGISKYTTLASGGLAAVGTRVMGIVGSFGQIGMLIGIGVAAFSALHGWMTKAAEQAGKFDKSLESNNAAIKTLSDTIDVINSKPFGQQFTTASLMARSTAFLELANSISILAEDYDKLNQAVSGSWWDRAINGIQRLWGGDIGSKMSESMSKSIMTSINKLASGQEGDAIRKRLSTLLNIDPNFTQSSLQKALKAKESDVKLMQDVAKAELEIANKSAIASSKLKEFDEVLQAGTESYKKFSDKFKVSNEFTNLGESIVAMADKLPGVFDTPQAAVEKLLSLSKDAAALSLFDEKDRANIIKYSSELDNINKAISENSVALQKAKEKAAGLDDEVASKTRVVSTYRGVETQYEGGTALAFRAEAARKDVEAISASLEASNARAAQVIAEFPGINLNTFEKGTELIKIGMIAAASKAGGALASAATSILGNLPGMAQVQADLQQQQLASENALIRAQMEMLKATHENTAATELTNVLMKEANALATVKEIEAKGITSAGDFSRYDRARSDLNSVETERKVAAGKMELLRTAGEGTAKSIDAINDAYKNGDEIIRKSAAGLLSYVLQISGLRNQLNSNADKAAAIELKKYADTQAELLGVYKQELGTTRERISLSEKQLAIDVRNGSVSEAERIEKEKQNKLALVGVDAAEKIAELNTRELVANRALAALDAQGKNTKEARVALAAEMEKRIIAINNLVAATAEIEQDAAVKQTTYLQNKLAGEQKLAALRSGIGFNNRETNNAVLQEEITLAEKLGYLRTEDLERLKARQQAESLSLGLNKTLFQEAQAHAAKLSELDVGIATAGKDSEKGKALQAQKDLEVESYNVAIANEGTLYSAKLKTLEATTALNVETAKFAEIIGSLKSLDTVFEGLGGSLEGFGSKLADVATAFKDAAKEAKTNADLVKEAQTNYDNSDSKDRLKYAKDLDNAKAKATKDELSGISKIAGASKKLFSEKTAAHKALSAVERVSAAMSFALQAKQMAMDLAALPGKIAGGVGTLFSQGGFAGFAGAAAFLAMMASLGANTGGAKSGVGAADMQAVQGTGQAYVNGRVEDTGKGVLGDSTAKNADIVNSISMLQDLNIDGININRKMLYALEQIENNTKVLAAKAYGIKGLTGGPSAFGTTEKSNPGFLGLFASSTSIIDTGIKAMAGATVDTIDKFIAQYETVQKTKSGFLGIGGGTKVRENVKPLEAEFAKDVGSLFKSGKEALSLAFSELGLGSKEAVDEFVGAFNIENFRTSFKDLKGDELVSALNATIGETLSDAVRGLAPFLKDYRQLGEGMFGTAIRVSTELTHVSTAMTFLGNSLTLLPNVANEVSQATIDANEAAKQKILETTAAFQAAQAGLEYVYFDGEGVKATAESVEALTKAEEALTAANIEATKAAEQLMTEKYKDIRANIEPTQRIIEATGGIERFNDAFSFYIDNFMTASERMAAKVPLVVQTLQELDAEFPNLGIAALTTRDQFSLLVKSLDLTTEAGASLYGKLMGVAKDFAKVTPALKDKSPVVYLGGYIETKDTSDTKSSGPTAEDIAKQARKQEIQIMKLQGKAAEALAAEREDEIAAMDASLHAAQRLIHALQDKEKLDKSLLDIERQILTLTGQNAALTLAKRAEELEGLSATEKVRKEYIFALEDEQSLKAQITTAYDKESNALKGTIDRLKQATKTLKDFRDQLLLGDKTTLTPAEQYSEAKRQALAVAEVLNKIPTTEEEKLAQSEAATKLPQVANAFLEASRNYYASGDMYQSDFSTVLDYTDTVTGILESQQTDAEKQLEQLTAIKDTLTFIDRNTKTVSELIPQLITAVQTVAIAQAKAAGTGSEAAAGAPTISDKYGINEDTVLNGVRISSGGSIMDTNSNTIMSKAGASASIDEVKNLLLQNGVNADGSLNTGNIAILLAQAKSLGASMSTIDAILGMPDGTTKAYGESQGIASFAVGTNWIPEDMVAQVHEGERIMPKADNVELINAVAGRRNNEQALVLEIRKLNAKIEALETTVANGAVMNARATDRNTEAVVGAVTNTATKTQFTNKVSERAKIQ
jgi:hypothetical protein